MVWKTYGCCCASEDCGEEKEEEKEKVKEKRKRIKISFSHGSY